MADRRSRRAKLEAMAAQEASPAEAAVARALLAAMGPPPKVRAGLLSRDEILGEPDKARPTRIVRMRGAGEFTIVVEVDEDEL